MAPKTLVRFQKKGLTSLAKLELSPEIETLDVSHNRLRSLADLPKLPKLKTLFATGNPLRDLRGLAKVPTLSELYVDVDNPSAAAKLPNLRLMMVKTKAKDLRFLAGSKLEYLSIAAPLTSLTGIEKLPALGQLIIHGAKLGKLSAVTHPILWKLIVSESGLERVPALATPKLLLALFYDNAISSMGTLDAPLLFNLGLHGNPLSHLEGLERLPALNQLWIDGRRIKTIAKATDARLRALGDKLRFSIARRGGADYASFASKKQIV